MQIGRRPQYDGHAERFGSVYNAYMDRPTLLGLLGDVAELTILDAGCGPGPYAEELVRRGAKVVGFDQSPDMVASAARRASAAEFRVHDLADPLDWIQDQSFDAAVSALTIHHVDHRVAALREVHRVLKPGGVLAVSTLHPVKDWLSHGRSYFDVGIVEEYWSETFRVPTNTPYLIAFRLRK